MPAIQGRSRSAYEQNRWIAKGDFQIAAIAPNDGTWQPVQGLWPLTVCVAVRASAFTGELRVCNSRRRPDDTDNTWPSIYTFTEARVITLEQPFIWVKLQVTALVIDLSVEDPGPDQPLNANYAAGGQGG